MVRVISCAAVGAVLIMAVQAVAATREYEGVFPAAPGGSMSYQVNTTAQDKVRRFKVNTLPMTCNEGPGNITTSFDKAMKLDAHNKFSGSKHVVNDQNGIDYVVKISGTAGKQSGHGTFQFKGDTGNDGFHNCDTGKAEWEAKKAP